MLRNCFRNFQIPELVTHQYTNRMVNRLGIGFPIPRYKNLKIPFFKARVAGLRFVPEIRNNSRRLSYYLNYVYKKKKIYTIFHVKYNIRNYLYIRPPVHDSKRAPPNTQTQYCEQSFGCGQYPNSSGHLNPSFCFCS